MQHNSLCAARAHLQQLRRGSALLWIHFATTVEEIHHVRRDSTLRIRQAGATYLEQGLQWRDIVVRRHAIEQLKANYAQAPDVHFEPVRLGLDDLLQAA